MDDMLLRSLLKALVLPPTVNILAILFALLFLKHWRFLRNLVIALSSVSVLVLSLPVTAQFLAKRIEIYPALHVHQFDASDYQAIVILGAGRHRQAPEYGYSDIPRAIALERLRYGAYLQKKTGLPILVTGGTWQTDHVPEAEFMTRVIEQEFLGTVRWQEKQSRTTWENATYSKQLLAEEGLHRVLLVNHAWHMPRAVYSFEEAGLVVKPAPTVFRSFPEVKHDPYAYVPQTGALMTSAYMVHELLGHYWYRLVA